MGKTKTAPSIDIRMDSYRKRQHNAHIKEGLIDKTQKEETMEPKEKDDVSISESGKRRVDSIVDEIAEENVDFAPLAHSVEYRYSSGRVQQTEEEVHGRE